MFPQVLFIPQLELVNATIDVTQVFGTASLKARQDTFLKQV